MSWLQPLPSPKLKPLPPIPHKPSDDNEPPRRKDEVSAEVPKLGVSAESHRASHFETPTFEKDKV
jgi:hypothetical protein